MKEFVLDWKEKEVIVVAEAYKTERAIKVFNAVLLGGKFSKMEAEYGVKASALRNIFYDVGNRIIDSKCKKLRGTITDPEDKEDFSNFWWGLHSNKEAMSQLPIIDESWFKIRLSKKNDAEFHIDRINEQIEHHESMLKKCRKDLKEWQGR